MADPGKVLIDDDSLQNYGKDWTTLYDAAPSAIVFPKIGIERIRAEFAPTESPWAPKSVLAWVGATLEASSPAPVLAGN